MFLMVQHHAQYIRGGQSWSEGAAQGLAGHHLASGEHLPCASLVLYILGFFLITVIIIIFFLFCSIKLSLLQLMHSLTSTLSSLPHPTVEGRRRGK